ncbi:unnamed protein product [Blepharisma stoltei]|uniref:Uncharacterized protein n=1 Tax=Blepharisma stoltei TaxID=1481888 RepID=A0AAU9J4I7_9CILI|nr:unnamed protein product [Blepharisma stoltei]
MIEPCNYDSSENNFPDKITIIKSSDCYEFCISSGCTLELLENDKCDDGNIYIRMQNTRMRLRFRTMWILC